MNEDDACFLPPLWDVVLVSFDARPLPATALAYADQIQGVQARAREVEKSDDPPEL